jgi:hypothetical protein
MNKKHDGGQVSNFDLKLDYNLLYQILL